MTNFSSKNFFLFVLHTKVLDFVHVAANYACQEEQSQVKSVYFSINMYKTNAKLFNGLFYYVYFLYLKFLMACNFFSIT